MSQLAHTTCQPLLALPVLTPQKSAKGQAKGKPNKTKGFANSQGNSLRKWIFYGQATLQPIERLSLRPRVSISTKLSRQAAKPK